MEKKKKKEGKPTTSTLCMKTTNRNSLLYLLLPAWLSLYYFKFCSSLPLSSHLYMLLLHLLLLFILLLSRVQAPSYYALLFDKTVLSLATRATTTVEGGALLPTPKKN